MSTDYAMSMKHSKDWNVRSAQLQFDLVAYVYGSEGHKKKLEELAKRWINKDFNEDKAPGGKSWTEGNLICLLSDQEYRYKDTILFADEDEKRGAFVSTRKA